MSAFCPDKRAPGMEQLNLQPCTQRGPRRLPPCLWHPKGAEQSVERMMTKTYEQTSKPRPCEQDLSPSVEENVQSMETIVCQKKGCRKNEKNGYLV